MPLKLILEKVTLAALNKIYSRTSLQQSINCHLLHQPAQRDHNNRPKVQEFPPSPTNVKSPARLIRFISISPARNQAAVTSYYIK